MTLRVHVFFYLLIAIRPVILNAQETEPLKLTLVECENLAVANNLKIKQAELDLEFSKARQIQASHARILPKFEFKHVIGTSTRARAAFTDTGVLFSPDSTFKFSDIRFYTEAELNLIQPLFTFGKLSGLNTAARYGVNADEANVDKEKDAIRLQTREAYWNFVLSNEMLTVVEEAKREVEKASQKIEDKLDEGSDDVSQTDLFKLQIFEYEVNKQYRQTLDDIELARSNLKSALGLRAGREIEITDAHLDPLAVGLESLSFYQDLALQSRPELSQLRAGISARRALVGVSRSDYYPQFFLGGQVKYNFALDRFDSKNPFVNNPYNFFRPGVVFGLNMNLNFLQTKDKVRLAQSEYSKLASKELLLIEGVKLEVEEAYLDAKQAETNTNESRKALRASDNWLRSVTMTFDLGIGDVNDLISAFQANSKMKREHFKNIFNFNTALAKLSRVVGQDFYPD